MRKKAAVYSKHYLTKKAEDPDSGRIWQKYSDLQRGGDPGIKKGQLPVTFVIYAQYIFMLYKHRRISSTFREDHNNQYNTRKSHNKHDKGLHQLFNHN